MVLVELQRLLTGSWALREEMRLSRVPGSKSAKLLNICTFRASKQSGQVTNAI